MPEGKTFGWGIMGTGRIASDFASDLKLLPNALHAAVFSRDQANADAFATKYDFVKAYSDIEHFINDSAVDIVYVATPNTLHLPQALRSIRAGKAVLIEKPVVPSTTELDVLTREAARNSVFVMEAMWIRFLPGVVAVKRLIDEGVIGEVTAISGTLSWRHEYDAASRLFSKALGGGASLDLGVYLLSLTMQLMGEPERISGSWTKAPSGVDLSAFYRLHYGKMVADLLCGFDMDRTNCFTITGSKGVIRIADPFIRAARVEVMTGSIARRIMTTAGTGKLGKVVSRLRFPGHTVSDFRYPGHGLSFQAAAVMQAMRDGKTAHELMPISDSAAVLRAISLLLTHPPVEKI